MTTFDQTYNKAVSASLGTTFKAAHIWYHDAIYHFNVAAIRKWSGYFFEPHIIPKIGKRVYIGYAGEWHRDPIDYHKHTSLVPAENMNSKEMRLIHYEAIKVDKKNGADIQAALSDAKSKVKNDMSHYKAMLAESKKVGWPKSFMTDLTNHDKRELTYRSPRLPVGWILRDSGTNIVFPEKEKISDWVGIMKRGNGLDNTLFYGWESGHLRKMSPDQWGTWISRMHRYMLGESSRED